MNAHWKVAFHTGMRFGRPMLGCVPDTADRGDGAASIREIEALQPLLEQAIGSRLRLDKALGPAAYVADLGVLVPQAAADGVLHLVYDVCFRFSRSARRYTILGARRERYLTEVAQALLEQHGFIHADGEHRSR